MAGPEAGRDGLTVDVQAVAPGAGGPRRLVRAVALVGAAAVGMTLLGIALTGPRPEPAPSADGPTPTPTIHPDVAALPAPAPPDFAAPSWRILEAAGASPATARATGVVPAGTERLALLVGCSGTGILRMRLDGVAVDFDCARGLLDGAFVPPLDGESELVVEPDGAVRYAVQVRGWAPVAPVFRPPAAVLASNGRTVPGFAGCGLSFALADGTRAADACGPSWMPMPDDRTLAVAAPTEYLLTMFDAWILHAVVVDVTDHAGIVPAGRAVPYARIESGAELGAARTLLFLALNDGDFGARLTVTAEREGSTFTVPYYFRLRVGG